MHGGSTLQVGFPSLTGVFGFYSHILVTKHTLSDIFLKYMDDFRLDGNTYFGKVSSVVRLAKFIVSLIWSIYDK